MKAKDLIKILGQHPELWVKVAETKKHEDNVPTMQILECEIAELEDAEETIFLLWIEPNPDTTTIQSVEALHQEIKKYKELFEEECISHHHTRKALAEIKTKHTQHEQ